MEKKIVLCLLCLSLFIGVSAQQRYFEVKDESPQNGVFSGLDDEAGVIIVCNQSKTLSFDSSMDKTVNIYKTDKEGSNILYYLIFKVGRKYKGRVLTLICPGYLNTTIGLELQPKQLKKYVLFDPNDEVDGGCYQQHRVKGMRYFDDANYREAKSEFMLSLECTDSNKPEAREKIAICDSIMMLLKSADAKFELLKYGEANADYHKIQMLNPLDKYVINRIFECNRSQDVLCNSYYQAAEQYFRDKDYDKARVLYQRVVDRQGAESVNSSLKISEIDRLERHSINRERVLTYEFDSNTAIGLSYGTYGAHSHGYFTLRLNTAVFDLARSEYVFNKKPEFNMSFGWTVNLVKRYLWLFLGPGATSVVKYQVDPKKWGDSKMTDDEAEKITEEQVTAKAKNDGKEIKDYLKAKYKFAISTEAGLVFKYWHLALRYTFQYRWAVSKGDQSYIGNVRNVIGLGFAF